MTVFMTHHIVFAVIIGFCLDLIIGDPYWLYHPVRLIGKLIELTERLFRSIFGTGKTNERVAGTLTAICVMTISTAVPSLVLYFCYHLNFWVGFILETFWCYQLLATRSLKTESMKVYDALQTGDIEKSRYAVSMIVGRDTKSLDEAGVTKAAVETIAESTSDGIIAPMLFMMIGGAGAGFFYKSINTMDSMIGYKNDKYRYFGTFAAVMDDIVNFIPARLSGLLMVLASGFCGYNMANGFRIFLRDRKKHASPNSAHTEAVMAGALDIQLAGDAWYFGVLHHKQTLGDSTREIEPDDIVKANRILYMTAILSCVVFALLKILCTVLLSLR